MHGYLFFAVSFSLVGLVQFVVSGGKHVQASRLADEIAVLIRPF